MVDKGAIKATKSEDNQKIFLVCKNIIQNHEGEHGEVVLDESLADLAFRLRDETIEMVRPVKYLGCRWVDAVCKVIPYCEGRVPCKECGHETIKKLFDWSKDAQPIHWIIAALILQEMLQKEMRTH